MKANSYSSQDALEDIEEHRLTVTWHFNGHDVQAVVYDHKGNNRATAGDIKTAVLRCLKQSGATPRKDS